MNATARRFDQAARHYDHAATVQAEIASRLVDWADDNKPEHILDIGCGTGFVLKKARQRWPQAALTGLDASPDMLREAQHKVPDLQALESDAATVEFEPQQFDVIFSGMMLHWLPDPRAALRRWWRWLKPQGFLYVALPVDGSFQEWQDLCRAHNLQDGLWPLPLANFADDLADRHTLGTMPVIYDSVRDFLWRLKSTGASRPRSDHVPFNVVAMRKLFASAPEPFTVTYKILYIAIQSADSI